MTDLATYIQIRTNDVEVVFHFQRLLEDRIFFKYCGKQWFAQHISWETDSSVLQEATVGDIILCVPKRKG
jgi:hypothetical protein